MVVCVGESLTEPDACELVVTVREDEPAAAVMVIPVALLACQVKVTLCPELIEVELAEKFTVGSVL